MDFLLPRRRAPRRRVVTPVLLCILALLATPARAETLAPRVTLTDHSRDSQDSMPQGNGDFGLNVWTESDGSVLFYIGKTDEWAEATAAEMSSQRDHLVKLARVRVRLELIPPERRKDIIMADSPLP